MQLDTSIITRKEANESCQRTSLIDATITSTWSLLTQWDLRVQESKRDNILFGPLSS